MTPDGGREGESSARIINGTRRKNERTMYQVCGIFIREYTALPARRGVR